MTRQQLADALDDPETKVFFAKAIAHHDALEVGIRVDAETAWLLFSPHKRANLISKVEHAAELLRAPEPTTPRKRAPRNA